MKFTKEMLKQRTDEYGNINLSYTNITALPDNLTVGGSLDLSFTKITALPDNLTVGGYLYLSNTNITALPDNLTVGGYLYLRNTKITALPDNLKVGGFLYLDGANIAESELRKVKSLKNGDEGLNRYIYADDILTQYKRKKKYGEYTIYIGKIPGKNLVKKGSLYAHCEKISDGIADIAFKECKERGAEQYRNISLTDKIKTNDIITMYRVITGACRQGTNSFLQGIKNIKSEYTVSEAIEITKGQYGSEVFKEFFEK